MRQAFGGAYLCEHGHETNLYLFDSKPDERNCPRCDDGTRAKLVRILDLGGNSTKGRKRKLKSNVEGRITRPQFRRIDLVLRNRLGEAGTLKTKWAGFRGGFGKLTRNVAKPHTPILQNGRLNAFPRIPIAPKSLGSGSVKPLPHSGEPTQTSEDALTIRCEGSSRLLLSEGTDYRKKNRKATS